MSQANFPDPHILWIGFFYSGSTAIHIATDAAADHRIQFQQFSGKVNPFHRDIGQCGALGRQNLLDIAVDSLVLDVGIAGKNTILMPHHPR